MSRGDLARRSGKQMLDLMDQLSKKRVTHTAMKLCDTGRRHNLILERK